MRRRRLTRTTCFAATIAGMLALTGGFALAAGGFGLGNVSPVYQGSQTVTVSTVTGLIWISATLVRLGATVVSTTCTQATPCSVTAAGARDCAGGVGGCAARTWVERVTLQTVARTPFPANPINITMYLTVNGVDFTGTSFYYSQPSATNAPQNIIQYFGVGTALTGPGTVSLITVLATS